MKFNTFLWSTILYTIVACLNLSTLTIKAQDCEEDDSFSTLLGSTISAPYTQFSGCGGVSTFTLKIEEGAAGCSNDNTKGLQSITFIHEYTSPAYSTVSVGDYIQRADIDRSRNASGQPLNDDEFKITFCDGSTIDLNGDYFPEATSGQGESFVPYQEGGVQYDDNGTITTITHPEKTGPNVGKKTLPAGKVDVKVVTSNNGLNRRVEYKINDVCAYEVDVTETAHAACYRVAAGGGLVEQNGSRREKNITLQCDKKDFCQSKLEGTQCNTDVNLNGYFNLVGVPGGQNYQLKLEEMYGNPQYDYEIQAPPCSTCTTVAKSSFYSLLNYQYYIAYVQVNGGGWGVPCTLYTTPNAMYKIDRSSNGESFSINLYPNPSHDNGFNLNISEFTEELNQIIIQVYDIFGKQVYNRRFVTERTEFSAKINHEGSWIPGVYLVNTIINGKTFNRKVTVK